MACSLARTLQADVGSHVQVKGDRYGTVLAGESDPLSTLRRIDVASIDHDAATLHCIKCDGVRCGGVMLTR